MDQISATTAIKKACNYVGGQSEMAKRLGISPPTVNQWNSKNSSTTLP